MTKNEAINFKFTYLGQTVLRYETPPEIVKEIYDTYLRLKKKKRLYNWNTQLIGKIKNEHSLFWASANEERYKKHNHLSDRVLDFFKARVVHYLKWNKIKDYRYKLNSIWINEMKAGEYNPIHVHMGDLWTGLSSVMIIKLPKNYGKEWARPDKPSNGQLGFAGYGGGCLAKTDYTPPNLKPGDFFLFPYDLRHYVYPFKGKEKRISLAMNVDVAHDIFASSQV